MNRPDTNPLPLADVLSPAAGFEWSHGVAIALQIVEQLMPEGQFVVGTFPDADRIALSPGGFLLTQFEAPGREPLAGFGRLLHRLLGQTSPPPALRLLVMQASAARPTVVLEDLIRDLKKWDPPNRLALLTDLYQRAAQHQAEPEASIVEPLAKPPKKRVARQAASTGDRGSRPVFMPHVVIAASLAGTAGLLITFLLIGPKASDTAMPIPLLGVDVAAAAAGPFVRPDPVIAPAPAAVADAVPGPAPAVGPSVATAAPSAPVANPRVATAALPAPAVAPRAATAASTAPVARVPERSAAPPPVSPTAPSVARAVNPAAAAPRAAEVASYSPAVLREAEEQFRRARLLFEQHDYQAAADAFHGVVEVLERGDPTLELRLIAAELAGASRALSTNVAAESARVYTSADEEVTEPIARANLPPPAGPGTPANRIGTLELLIDTRGQVESAHLVGGDQHFRDRWLISAAKAWLFQPATRDGRPVRFLKRHTFLLDRVPGLQ